MKKILQRLVISFSFLLVLLLFFSPLVFATGGDEENIEDNNSTINDDVIENPVVEDTDLENNSVWEQINQYLTEVGFINWLEQEFLPALPQSVWSLILSLLVFLTTYRKNKQGSLDIQTSITNMGLAKASMDTTNNKLDSLITNDVAKMINQMKEIAKEVNATNLDMKQYKADLKSEIDQIKAIEKAMKEMLLTAFTNTSELVANGQAENIAKVATRYDKEKTETKENA